MNRAPYASDPVHSRGRRHGGPGQLGGEGGQRGPRTAFQRDRDRIIHSVAFRRLRHKTQVFVAPDGDHYRVRLTHSLEVAQIGRTIARALGLDEDLTEALCLAHDLGHPPFGHAGEDALDAALAAHGGFDHNAQTLRTLTRLESPYPDFRGLNLSWEVLEGLAKHNGPIRGEPNWALAEIDADFPLELDRWPSLEAQIAAVSDDIAYDNHDIDDGLRAGFLCLDQLLSLPSLERQWRAVEARWPAIGREAQLRELVRDQIGLMVNDVIDATRRRFGEAGIETAADVAAAGRLIGGFSDGMRTEERALKAFMYDKLYHHPEQVAVAESARKTVAALFAAYCADPERLPAEWRASLPPAEPERSRHIADFLAGMTDRYAMRQYAELFGTAPAGLGNV